MAQVLYGLVWIFVILLLIRVVVSWVQAFARQWSPTGPLLVVLEGVYTATDPPIKLVRRWVPPIRIGQVMFDLAFMIVFIACFLLMQLIASLALV